MIKFTVEQAKKVVAGAPVGSVYWLEAQRVLREGPRLAIETECPSYRDVNDDDGEGT